MVAPEAVSVVLLPLQIAGEAAVAVTVGAVPTVIITVLLLVQPFAAVPTTVYVVVDAGVTVTEEPASEPGFQA